MQDSKCVSTLKRAKYLILASSLTMVYVTAALYIIVAASGNTEGSERPSPGRFPPPIERCDLPLWDRVRSMCP